MFREVSYTVRHANAGGTGIGVIPSGGRGVRGGVPPGKAATNHILQEQQNIEYDFDRRHPAAYRVSVTSPQVSVLVVEDDPGIATQLVRGLERAGYTADSVAMGSEALRRPASDVVLLDLGLPDVDGIDVCRRLRAGSDTAIIVVTARGEEADRVLALDEGADDYLVKPFGLAELLARIRAVLRRGRRAGGSGGSAEVLRHGPLTVDLRTRKVTMSGEEVALTPKEFAILECLATDPGRLISRQEIVERAWDEHWYGPTKVLDVHLAALRRKIGDPSLIETVYGHGFRLAERSTAAEHPTTGHPATGHPATGHPATGA